MAATFTTEQFLPIMFEVVDGRGRKVDIDGAPSVTVSDETVATVGVPVKDGLAWKADLISVTPGSARVTFEADADLGEGVQTVVGFLDFDVTMDPRTGARIVSLMVGEPADKAV